MKRKSFILLIIFIFAALQANAIFIKSNKGTITGGILITPSSPLEFLYRQGGSAVSGAIEDIYLNPAGLFNLTKKGISLSYTPYLNFSNLDSVKYAMPFLNASSIGFGFKYFSVANDGYDEFGAGTGKFSDKDMLFTFSYARKLIRDIKVGVNSKLLMSTLATYKATTVAFDLGIKGKAIGNAVDYGIVLQNVGFGQKFDRVSNPLPFIIKSGIFYNYEKMDLSFDVIFLLDDSPYFNFVYGYKIKSNLKGLFNLIVDDKQFNMSDVRFGILSEVKGFSVDLSLAPAVNGAVLGMVPSLAIKKYF